MLKPKIKVMVHRDPWKRDYGIMIAAENSDGSMNIAKNMVFEPVPDHIYVEPTMTVSPETAQNLFDELWRAGLRPLDGTGNGGHIGALERHLDDMRILAGVKDKK